MQAFETLKSLRTDIIVAILTLTGVFELKRVTVALDSTIAKRELRVAWDQATSLARKDKAQPTEAFKKTKTIVGYAVVYCVVEGRVEILLRRGVLRQGNGVLGEEDAVNIDDYQEFVLKYGSDLGKGPTWALTHTHRAKDRRQTERQTGDVYYEDFE